MTGNPEDPTTWDTSRPPTYGDLAVAGVSHVTARSAMTQWQYEVLLRHGPTGARATCRASDEQQATYAAWIALHRTLTEHDQIERTNET